GFGWCHPLCHGDLGALELILEAERALDAPGLDGERDRGLVQLLASLDQHGFLSGLPGHVEAPGLMDGLAGLGFGLLRQAFPDRVPSVLLLDPPVASGLN
ncbi:MAG TPA: lanthionine synthetase LanC family protein, partial [Thermoanaerobaculia bacterium]